MYTLHNTDCLSHMLSMPENSVDAIITDLPYGTTACAWDTIIPFEPMWEAVKHVLKPDGAFVTTASQPFTSLLVCSNLEGFRCEWIWFKNRGSGHLNAKLMPLKQHENIIVFGAKSTYNPIFEEYSASFKKRFKRGDVINRSRYKHKADVYGSFKANDTTALNPNGRCPSSVQFFKTVAIQNGDRMHPTQKPVALYKYLVQTYTNPGDTVLDMCMGSGTTIVACIETGRDAIGCETNKEHFQTAEKRSHEASLQGQLFAPPSSANNGLQPDQTRAEQISML